MRACRVLSLYVAIIAASVSCASSTRQRPPADNKTLTAEQIEKHAHEPIEVMLQRKFPGVQVLRNSDGDITLNIRGASTTSGMPVQPLIVLNDMELDPRSGGLLDFVDPYDIESIKVLRGPETAIYGIRGGDGVIVIRTKGSSRKK